MKPDSMDRQGEQPSPLTNTGNESRRHSLLSDTHPRAEKVMIELYRQMPGWQKLRQVTELTQLVDELARSDIRRRHPNADEREVFLRLASRWLSPELMRNVYQWDPDREGY